MREQKKENKCQKYMRGILFFVVSFLCERRDFIDMNHDKTYYSKHTHLIWQRVAGPPSLVCNLYSRQRLERVVSRDLRVIKKNKNKPGHGVNLTSWLNEEAGENRS